MAYFLHAHSFLYFFIRQAAYLPTDKESYDFFTMQYEDVAEPQPLPTQAKPKASTSADDGADDDDASQAGSDATKQTTAKKAKGKQTTAHPGDQITV